MSKPAAAHRASEATSAPSAPDALPIRCQTLDNGLRVVVCETRGAPVVAIQVWVEVGSADEQPDEGGLAHVHEHMLFKGTARRKVGEIASEVEASGGEINAWTSYDQTVYHVVLASDFFDSGLDILADAIQNSAFDEGELSRELEVILEEIKRSEDQPSSRVSRALFSSAFNDHPYAQPVIGHSEVVSGFTREHVVRFFEAHYCTDRMTVVCVGDINADEAVAKIGEAFKGARQDARPLAERPEEPAQTEVRGELLTDDVEEAHLAIGFRGPSVRSEDLAALDVLSVLLGQGESSRLVQDLRQERHLVNEVYAYAYTPRDPGLFVVGSTLRRDDLQGAIAAIAGHVQRVFDEPVSEAELEKAQTILCSEAIYQRETVEGLARRLGFWTTMTQDPHFESVYQTQVRAVRPDDIRRVAHRYLGRDQANVVALVPQGETELDADGLKALVKAHFPETPAAVAPAIIAKAAAPRSLVKLESGARLIVEEDHTNPIVALRASWLGGARSESDETAGHSNLIADLMTKGTSTRSAADIASRIDSMAGQLEGFAGRNSIGLRGTFLHESFRRGFDLFCDAVRHASFPELELERTRRLVLEEIKSRGDNPAGMCFDLFNKTLWLSHPYRRDILGTEDSVKGATVDSLNAFRAARVQPQNAVVSMVGAVSVEQAVELANQAFAHSGADGEAVASWTPTDEALPDAPRVARAVRDRAQTHLVMGHRGLTVGAKDRFALEVLVSALTGQGGRLFLELRDKQSLCYAVSAFAVEGLEPGLFAVYMATSPEKVDTALGGIEGLLADVATNGITEEERTRAVRYLVGTHGIGLQRLGARASTMLYNTLYDLGHEAHLAYPQQIAAVTLEDIQRVAAKLFVPQARVTAIVGPESAGGPAANCTPSGLAYSI